MGIDRIGKGSGAPPAIGPPAPAKAGETGKAFEPSVSSAARASSVGAVASPLEQLKAGKIDFEGYLQTKVDEATAHLHGLAPVQLDAIRSMLRDQLASDPALTDLVKQATGHSPEPPPEE